MNRLALILGACVWLASVSSFAQYTLDLNTPESYDGYTLFAPNNSLTTYMMDNCSHVVNSWVSGNRPGLVCYFLEDGTLLRTGRVAGDDIHFGGTGGYLERMDWDGNQIWDMDLYEPLNYCQHHDVEYLSNGNILMVMWEYFTAAECVAAGFLSNEPRWSEMIWEVDPSQEGNPVVWEWHAWDHLVVDNPAAHPELIWTGCGRQSSPPNAESVDWLHCNTVAYNAGLDHIVLSMRAADEIWIIDHSTTTEEAAGHTGGNMGKGGDLLYRWGNPVSYDVGSSDDQTLYGQHDIHWIADGLVDAGKLMVYNNGDGRGWSSVDVFTPPTDAEGNYLMEAGTISGPETLDWTYVAPNPPDFFSEHISGAGRLPNGNTLICEGSPGHFFEVQLDGTVVWDFDGNAGVFRAYRYGPDYPGFEGIDLTPGESLDLDVEDCALFAGVEEAAASLVSYPNPTDGRIQILDASADMAFVWTDVRGTCVNVATTGHAEFDLSALPAGMYLLHATSGSRTTTQRILKR